MIIYLASVEGQCKILVVTVRHRTAWSRNTIDRNAWGLSSPSKGDREAMDIVYR